jgi:polysaccharide pyruvyl transferase CsaB
MPEAAIMGFYGYENTGDEAVLLGTIAALRAAMPDIAITVFSAQPEQTAERYGVVSVPIGRRFEGLIAIASTIRRADLFLLGGGGLLQDREVRIVPFWLSRFFLALTVHTPAVFFAQGVGPLDTRLGRGLTRAAASRAAAITVRDIPSARLLQSLGVKRTVHVTADAALALEPLPKPDAYTRARWGLEPNRPYLAFVPRGWPGMAEMADDIAQTLAGFARGSGVGIALVPFQMPDDRPVVDRIVSAWPDNADAPVVVYSGSDPRTMQVVLSGMEMVVGMRLHAAILSALQGVPVLGLGYDPKVALFFERLSLPEWSLVWDADLPARLKESLRGFWEHRDEARRTMIDRMQVLRSAALENGQVVKRVWESRKLSRQ